MLSLVGKFTPVRGLRERTNAGFHASPGLVSGIWATVTQLSVVLAALSTLRDSFSIGLHSRRNKPTHLLGQLESRFLSP